jgi:heat shock protein HslJ
MGSYTVEGNKLKFKPLATSMMMCEATAKLESAFLKMLGTVTGYAIRGETLTLLAGDKAIAEFHPGGS